jgi:hypothetical protein
MAKVDCPSTPHLSNVPKLSDGGGWRRPCITGGKAAAETRAVTAVDVRCSAWLDDSLTRSICGMNVYRTSVAVWRWTMPKCLCDGCAWKRLLAVMTGEVRAAALE